ncbi:hypothetical protein Bhyg_07196 [Pseudolycoriella hygida]|uniref:Uncharacterized protein n=1 Tax=Pseudolycoriella hygida TaxID=35572 RepID=A0A9Q0N441_9DIPT|nr:hypothetical protein Bhyg_07196 [Pseudolycoriella hygida]
MVPQHSQDGAMSRAEFDLLTSTTTSHNISVTGGTQSSSMVFGSQLVDKNSITPYSDATQEKRKQLTEHYHSIQENKSLTKCDLTCVIDEHIN